MNCSTILSWYNSVSYDIKLRFYLCYDLPMSVQVKIPVPNFFMKQIFSKNNDFKFGSSVKYIGVISSLLFYHNYYICREKLERDCKMFCAGDKELNCGGNNEVGVFKVSSLHVVVLLDVSFAWFMFGFLLFQILSFPAPNLEYLGCYNDDNSNRCSTVVWNVHEMFSVVTAKHYYYF